jgi:hypothetical protein
MIEFRSGGRRVSSDEFFENLKRQAIEQGMKELEQRIHARRGSAEGRVGEHLNEATITQLGSILECGNTSSHLDCRAALKGPKQRG